MNNFEKTQQLVSKTGCSYEEAKAALEACGWDMIDAVISLEKEGRISKETASHKTAESTEAAAEITAEVITVGSSDDSYASGNRSDDAGAGSKGKSEKRTHRLWQRIKRFLFNNRMLIIESNGQLVKDVPILVPIIALLVFFWATLGAAVVLMLFGVRFHFAGENLGKTNINNTMDKATDYAEKFRSDIAGKANERKNSDN